VHSFGIPSLQLVAGACKPQTTPAASCTRQPGRRAVPPRSVALMNLVVVIFGVSFVVGVALLIGWVQAHAREDAWRNIAEARRDHHARDRALVQCLRLPRCDVCPIDRYLRDWR